MSETPHGPVTGRSGAIRDIARSEVLHRHARLTRHGRPVFCSPSQAEISGVAIPRQGPGTDGKVIYPSREAAEAAARELEALGARPLRSYLCGRSRSGHYHLTSDCTGRLPAGSPSSLADARSSGAAARPLRERIPQQRRPLAS